MNDSEMQVPRKRGRPARNTRIDENAISSRGGTRKKQRIPLDGHRAPHGIPDEYKDPNYHRCFVADYPESPGNVQTYLDAAYEFVAETVVDAGVTTVSTASKYGAVVTRDGKRGVVMYLMQQPLEYWNEDEAIRNAKIDAKDPRGAVKQLVDGLDNTGAQGYIPRVT